jgi:hypothetical protein
VECISFCARYYVSIQGFYAGFRPVASRSATNFQPVGPGARPVFGFVAADIVTGFTIRQPLASPLQISAEFVLWLTDHTGTQA